MEDAVALAWAFRTHGEDIWRATRAYEDERRPVTWVSCWPAARG